jgi:hypothetical protein
MYTFRESKVVEGGTCEDEARHPEFVAVNKKMNREFDVPIRRMWQEGLAGFFIEPKKRFFRSVIRSEKIGSC